MLGISGAVQPSDGHVLEIYVPGNLPIGEYDIILRQYRPYKLSSGGSTFYHMDQITLGTPYYEQIETPSGAATDSGFGEGGFGTGTFGGDDPEIV